MNWLEEVNNEENHIKEIFSFDEYMDIFEGHAPRELRNTALYLRDMFNHYGKDEQGFFKLFKKEHPNAPAVSGQRKVQERIYQNLEYFTEEGFNNRFILLVGPNGSSKSSIVKKIMRAAEDYSHADEGALYSFSWIFPIDNYVKGNVGLADSRSTRSVETYAHLEDTDISAILTSELKDHPLLLIPKKTRQKLIEKYLEDFPEQLQNVTNTYLYNGDLSKRNHLIYDALNKNYKGDVAQILKHIRVERIYIDKRYSTGAATIEPQLHVDAKIQQITMDRRLANLPPSLQSLNLFHMDGEIVLANRGILEFSDLLKRPLDAFKYLLMTMESKTVNLQGILTELDIFFIGSSNEVHFTAFKQHPDFNSFKGRFNFVKVPYLTSFRDEVNIYTEQVSNLSDQSIFEPHAIEALCLWAVMTRMRHPLNKNYQDKKLGDIVEKLTPLEKAIFIADNDIPEYLSQEEQQHLKIEKEALLDEFENDPMYEGKFGISPREVKQIIYELSSTYKSVSFIEVMDVLREHSARKDEYDFLQIGPQGDYHNAKKFLYLVEQYSLNQFDLEVRDSLGLVDNRSYEDFIAKYVMNITAMIKNEKIKNQVTAKFEEPDKFLVKEFESNIHLKESPEKFRSAILSKLGAWSLDNPGKEMIYTEVLDGITRQLKESFRNEQRKIIMRVGEDLVFFQAERKAQKEGKSMNSQVTKEGREQIEKIIGNLMSEHGYQEQGAINCLKYLIKKRYDTSKT
jgi:serine protein kinase